MGLTLSHRRARVVAADAGVATVTEDTNQIAIVVLKHQKYINSL